MVCVGILAVTRLNVVIPFLRQEDRCLPQQRFCLLCGQNTGGLPVKGFVACRQFTEGLFTRGAFSRQITAVVAEADGVGVQVLPRPVQTGQFAEVFIFPADILARIVPGVGQRCMQSAPRLHRQVQRVNRHRIFLMGSDKYDRFHAFTISKKQEECKKA